MKDQIDLSKMDSIYEIGPYGFNRLNRYWIEQNELMWDYIWENTNMKSYWADSLKGRLANDYERFINKSLPLKSKIRPLYWCIEDIRYVRGIIDRSLSLILPKTWFGHMMMIVAKKVNK